MGGLKFAMGVNRGRRSSYPHSFVTKFAGQGVGTEVGGKRNLGMAGGVPSQVNNYCGYIVHS